MASYTTNLLANDANRAQQNISENQNRMSQNEAMWAGMAKLGYSVADSYATAKAEAMFKATNLQLTDAVRDPESTLGFDDNGPVLERGIIKGNIEKFMDGVNEDYLKSNKMGSLAMMKYRQMMSKQIDSATEEVALNTANFVKKQTMDEVELNVNNIIKTDIFNGYESVSDWIVNSLDNVYPDIEETISKNAYMQELFKDAMAGTATSPMSGKKLAIALEMANHPTLYNSAQIQTTIRNASFSIALEEAVSAFKLTCDEKLKTGDFNGMYNEAASLIASYSSNGLLGYGETIDAEKSAQISQELNSYVANLYQNWNRKNIDANAEAFSELYDMERNGFRFTSEEQYLDWFAERGVDRAWITYDKEKWRGISSKLAENSAIDIASDLSDILQSVQNVTFEEWSRNHMGATEAQWEQSKQDTVEFVLSVVGNDAYLKAILKPMFGDSIEDIYDNVQRLATTAEYFSTMNVFHPDVQTVDLLSYGINNATNKSASEAFREVRTFVSSNTEQFDTEAKATEIIQKYHLTGENAETVRDMLSSRADTINTAYSNALKSNAEATWYNNLLATRTDPTVKGYKAFVKDWNSKHTGEDKISYTEQLTGETKYLAIETANKVEIADQTRQNALSDIVTGIINSGKPVTADAVVAGMKEYNYNQTSSGKSINVFTANEIESARVRYSASEAETNAKLAQATKASEFIESVKSKVTKEGSSFSDILQYAKDEYDYTKGEVYSILGTTADKLFDAELYESWTSDFIGNIDSFNKAIDKKSASEIEAYIATFPESEQNALRALLMTGDGKSIDLDSYSTDEKQQNALVESFLRGEAGTSGTLAATYMVNKIVMENADTIAQILMLEDPTIYQIAHDSLIAQFAEDAGRKMASNINKGIIFTSKESVTSAVVSAGYGSIDELVEAFNSHVPVSMRITSDTSNWDLATLKTIIATAELGKMQDSMMSAYDTYNGFTFDASGKKVSEAFKEELVPAMTSTLQRVDALNEMKATNGHVFDSVKGYPSSIWLRSDAQLSQKLYTETMTALSEIPTVQGRKEYLSSLDDSYLIEASLWERLENWAEFEVPEYLQLVDVENLIATSVGDVKNDLSDDIKFDVLQEYSSMMMKYANSNGQVDPMKLELEIRDMVYEKTSAIAYSYASGATVTAEVQTAYPKWDPSKKSTQQTMKADFYRLDKSKCEKNASSDPYTVYRKTQFAEGTTGRGEPMSPVVQQFYQSFYDPYAGENLNSIQVGVRSFALALASEGLNVDNLISMIDEQEAQGAINGIMDGLDATTRASVAKLALSFGQDFYHVQEVNKNTWEGDTYTLNGDGTMVNPETGMTVSWDNSGMTFHYRDGSVCPTAWMDPNADLYKMFGYEQKKWSASCQSVSTGSGRTESSYATDLAYVQDICEQMAQFNALVDFMSSHGVAMEYVTFYNVGNGGNADYYFPAKVANSNTDWNKKMQDAIDAPISAPLRNLLQLASRTSASYTNNRMYGKGGNITATSYSLTR